MSSWETNGKSDEWYTPEYVFDALGALFDMDVAAPGIRTFVPAKVFITENSLESKWSGFVWMNPPFGKRNGLYPWLKKFFDHRNGIALTPDRTSAPWCQYSLARCDGALFVKHKIKFHKPDGSIGRQPGSGTILFAAGCKACDALRNASANGLGHYFNSGKLSTGRSGFPVNIHN